MNKVKCKICGVEEDLHWSEQHNQRLLDKGMCFTCDFWDEKQMWHSVGDPNAVIIDGTHYYIGDPNATGHFRGYGGRPFTIKFNDGRVVTTGNLWCQGKIPEGHWRTLLPDNAFFLQK